MGDLLADQQPFDGPVLGELGGDCPCGRGPTIGTCHWTSSRILFRAFHDGATNWHLVNAADWACADCVGDVALAVATGKVREEMRRIAQERRAAS